MHGMNNIKVHSVYTCARLSVRIEQLDSRWRIFMKFYILGYSKIFREKETFIKI
jgi:hypothetical protein